MELKENKGRIFKNTYKTEDKHPEYKGEIDWKGERIEIALWVSKSENGIQYFSTAQSEPFKVGQSDSPTKNEGVNEGASDAVNDAESLPF